MSTRIGHTEFVRRYLTRYGRWLPKYLAGEATRASARRRSWSSYRSELEVN